jgi:hypothetical protein
MEYYWCQQHQTFTFDLHPNAGLPGRYGLQEVFEHNMTFIAEHIASWFDSGELSRDPESAQYLVGIVIAAETHFGSNRFQLDYSPDMVSGFRDQVVNDFDCSKIGDDSCLNAINAAFGTDFQLIQEIFPPSAECTSQTRSYCSTWDAYRNAILREHLGRIANIFTNAGVPPWLLFGHDLMGAGGFVGGPILLPNRNPGLTAYNPVFSVFEQYAGCTSRSKGTCRDWAIAEGFYGKSTCDDGKSPECYDDDLDHLFDLNAKFMHVMHQGIDATPLLGSGFEKGIHRWGMRYSNAYSDPHADLRFDPKTNVLSGCVYDADSVWMGPLDQTGTGNGTSLDLNGVELEIVVGDATPISTLVDVPNAEPWCGSSGHNLFLQLNLPSGDEAIRVRARDYPTDDWIDAYCYRCDDEQAPIIFVDTPAHGESINGTVVISGWATDASGVSSVTFAIDTGSVEISDYTYGVSRPGVCDVHAELGDPNCPLVGWTGTLQTKRYPNGEHTLGVTATDPSGNSETFNRTFIIDNPVDADPPVLYVDAPSHLQTVVGDVSVFGWATDASGVDSMAFAIDGSTVSLSNYGYGVSRPDVCDAYANLDDPNCPAVGWFGTLETASLPNGQHTFNVTATDPGGNSETFNRTFIVDNPVDADPPVLYVDAPSHLQTVVGDVSVFGWATDASGVDSMAFAIDGSTVSLSNYGYGVSRPGVCDAYANLDDPNCPAVGWFGTLETASLPNGQHTFNVTATDPGGNSETFNRTFIVDNPVDADPPVLYVEAPSHLQTVVGDVSVFGWATDASGVDSMAFAIDGSTVSLSNYGYGVSRPGVCDVYANLDDPNCPAVGWFGTLETASLTNGQHTFSVIAADPNGASTVFDRVFVVNNSSTADSKDARHSHRSP